MLEDYLFVDNSCEERLLLTHVAFVHPGLRRLNCTDVGDARASSFLSAALRFPRAAHG